MSELLEKVKAAISETSSGFYSLPADNPEWMLHHAQARAAIAAVAEWLGAQGFDKTDLALDVIAELRAAGDGR